MILLDINMEEGLIILLIGMLIVFTSLLLLFAIFHYMMPSILEVHSQKPKTSEEKAAPVVNDYTTGEEIAAVSTAIYVFLEEAHDEENAILTINQKPKSYSPWSSKIYATHHFGDR